MKKLLLLLSLLIPLSGFGASGTGKVDASYLEFVRQGSAPSTPNAGKIRAYALDADGNLYLRNSAGTAKKVPFSTEITNSDLTGSAAISNANLASMANATIKCRNTSGTGAPEDCTAAQVNTILAAAPGGGAASVLFSRHTSGSTTWSPSGSGSAIVILAGGGGGGAGGGNGSNGSQAGEGGGGSACIFLIPYTSQNYTINVGTGGAGGAAGGSASGTSGSNGGSTYILDQNGNVIAVCPGGLAGQPGHSNSTKFWKTPGGYGGQPSCTVNTGVAGADGENGGASTGAYYQGSAGGLKGTGTGDAGGTCGGGGGGGGAFGAGGNAGGGYSCGAATNGSGGGGGGGGSSGHPSVCNGTAGGNGGDGGIKIFQF